MKINTIIQHTPRSNLTFQPHTHTHIYIYRERERERERDWMVHALYSNHPYITKHINLLTMMMAHTQGNYAFGILHTHAGFVRLIHFYMVARLRLSLPLRHLISPPSYFLGL